MNIHLKEDIQDLKDLIKQYPADYKHPSELGWLYYANEQFDKASEWLIKSVSINGESALTQNRLGCIHIKRRKYQQALECFNKTIKIQPLNGYAYTNRAIAYHYLHDFDRAIYDRYRAIQILYLGERNMANIVPDLLGRKISNVKAISSLMRELPAV